MSPEDLTALRHAVELLENPGFAARLANWVGMPVEQIMKRLPAAAVAPVHKAVGIALRRCLDMALAGVGSQSGWLQSERAMKAAVAATGAAGGAFGLAALAIELPVTTTVMLRSIAEIARSEGEDVRTDEGALACLEVFALGGRPASGDPSEIAYFSVRAALAEEVRVALQFLAKKGSGRAGAPVIVRLLESIAARFGIVVTDKVAAQVVPVIGAIGGATINALFMDHFQDMAHGHFTVRRLERKYGAEAVKAEYSRLALQPRR